MNDTELDEILDSWIAPPVPASLRERVRARFTGSIGKATIPAAPRRWTSAFARIARKGLLAGAILGLVAFLLVVTQAIPQTIKLVSPPVQIPYTVDSKFVRYASDGASAIDMYSTSYNDQDGREIILSRSLPGNSFGTDLGRTLDAAQPLILRIFVGLSVVRQSDMESFRTAHFVHVGCPNPTCLAVEHYFLPKAAADAANGCVVGVPFDRETILGYQTAALRLPLGNRRRMTVWMAPDLACFALKVTLEDRQSDGSFRLAKGRQAFKVTWNP